MNSPNLEKVNKGKMKKAFTNYSWQSTWQLGILSLPAFLWFVIFSYIPMFGILIAFKDFDYRAGVFASEWCGFRNFIYLFTSNDAIRILKNTISYNLVFICLGVVAAISVALMLDSIKKKFAIKLYQTTMFLPYFISWVVVAYMTQAFLAFDGGMLNEFLKSVGKEPIRWYTETKHWPYFLVIAQLWKTIGFNTLLYYGSIIGIDTALYEAARIDGATKMQEIWKITIPMIKPTIIVLLILSVGNMMRADFGLFYYIPNNSGALYAVTDVIDTYIYRTIKGMGDIAGSSAASVFQSVVGFCMVMITNAIVKKVDGENSMF